MMAPFRRARMFEAERAFGLECGATIGLAQRNSHAGGQAFGGRPDLTHLKFIAYDLGEDADWELKSTTAEFQYRLYPPLEREARRGGGFVQGSNRILALAQQ
jgi:hypothetical protein